ncbi:MAG: hypothetical protein F4X97_11000 [Boseongicola sp. SB0662_bin_57]|nr:hypothetical protein [Boseongicola sp. SB0662_bin_57]
MTEKSHGKMKRMVKVPDGDRRPSFPASSPDTPYLFVSGARVENEPSFGGAISMEIQTDHFDSQTRYFLMSLPAALQLSKMLKKAVKSYLRHSPERE